MGLVIASERADLAAYVAAARGLLAHTGFERTGDPRTARGFRLDHVAEYLAARGRPDERATVHVAGSKGKGSTVAMVEAILRAAGATTLKLTSPDVHTARERVAVAGEPIAPALFAELATDLLADPATRTWSYFECLTVMGWLAAARSGCDWQVVEVGLGGRLDTTNAMTQKHVAAILPIDLEHTAILGGTIREIAAEKAGILTGPCACVVAPMRESAARVVGERARSVGAELHAVADECRATVRGQTLDGQRLDLSTPLRTYRGLMLPLLGRHQSENAATAVRAAELAWEREYSAALPERAVRQGLARVELPVRLEAVDRRPLVILDGMHTPLAARRVAEALRGLRLPAPRVLLFGMLGGRAPAALVSELREVVDLAVVAPPDSPRADDPARAERALAEAGIPTQRAASVERGLAHARALAGDEGCVIVGGSLYTAAEAREQLLAIGGDRALGLR